MAFVEIGDGPERRLDLRHDLRRHSEHFDYGFAGGGPARPARALRADVRGGDDRARAVCRRFEFAVPVPLTGDARARTEGRAREVTDRRERGKGG